MLGFSRWEKFRKFFILHSNKLGLNEQDFRFILDVIALLAIKSKTELIAKFQIYEKQGYVNWENQVTFESFYREIDAYKFGKHLDTQGVKRLIKIIRTNLPEFAG